MEINRFRRLSRGVAITATIISDGCRDYVVEIRHPRGPELLCDRRHRPLRFRSMAQARAAVANATEIHLSVRVAADEACAGSASEPTPFSTQLIYRQSA